MRPSVLPKSVAGSLTAAAFVIIAAMVLASVSPRAGEAPPVGPPCSCPDAHGKAGRPKFADLGIRLDESDEVAALESVHLALTRVEDGKAFVWRGSNGRLSGLVNPTSSFRNDDGALCRHIVVLLTTGYVTRKTEGVACRLANGRWRLDG
jgi:predicted outer membrane lipoprotein